LPLAIFTSFRFTPLGSPVVPSSLTLCLRPCWFRLRHFSPSSLMLAPHSPRSAFQLLPLAMPVRASPVVPSSLELLPLAMPVRAAPFFSKLANARSAFSVSAFTTSCSSSPTHTLPHPSSFASLGGLGVLAVQPLPLAMLVTAAPFFSKFANAHAAFTAFAAFSLSAFQPFSLSAFQRFSVSAFQLLLPQCSFAGTDPGPADFTRRSLAKLGHLF